MREQGVIDAASAGQPAAQAPPLRSRDDTDRLRDGIMALLQQSLASEMMCVLHYTWRREAPEGQSAGGVDEEFPSAYGEYAHAVWLAQRMVQLGGRPDFTPNAHDRPNHAGYSDATDLNEAVRANLDTALATVARCCKIIPSCQGRHSATLEILERILDQEQCHAIDLEYWLAH